MRRSLFDWIRRTENGLMPLDAALTALGDDGSMGRRTGEIPIGQVIGSVSRSEDFDADFRVTSRHLTQRLQRVKDARAAGARFPPVDLIQLGELYFVIDGHHRIAAAHAAGQLTINAHVVRICTIAYGMACLRLADLRSKAAERRFLDRIPLSTQVREELWLDCPVDWMRLADAAESWGYRRSLATGRAIDRRELARSWWQEEVRPVVEQLRSTGFGSELRDIELYAQAQAVREPDGAVRRPINP